MEEYNEDDTDSDCNIADYKSDFNGLNTVELEENFKILRKIMKEQYNSVNNIKTSSKK